MQIFLFLTWPKIRLVYIDKHFVDINDFSEQFCFKKYVITEFAKVLLTCIEKTFLTLKIEKF